MWSGGVTSIYQGSSSNIQNGYNLTSQIEQSVANMELKDVELFVFTYNLVFHSVFYKGTPKIPFVVGTSSQVISGYR